MPDPNEIKETEAVVEEPQTDPSTLSDAELDARLNPKEEEPPAEPPVEEPPKEEPPKEEPPKEPETITVPKDEWEKVKKRVLDKETFIQKQAREIGDLRKAREQFTQEIEQLKTIRNEAWNIDPDKAQRAAFAIAQREGSINQINAIESSEMNRQVVTQFQPDFDTVLPDIVQLVIEDGNDMADVEKFRVNPFAENPAVLVNLAKRAMDRKAITAKDAEITALKERIAKLEGKPAEVVKNIQKAMTQQKTITASSGQSGVSKPEVHESQIANLSDKALAKMLEERQKQETG